MKFLVAFLAVLGYASASVISPLVLGVNPGDAQAAAIDTRAAVRDNAQAWTDAARLAVDVNRNINENVYWNNVAANQNAVALAQNQAAAWSAAVTGRLGVAAPLGVSPLGIGAVNGWGAGWGLGAHGLGLRAW